MNVSILTGGSAAELEISLKSAETILDNLDTSLYSGRIIEIQGSKFIDKISGKTIDKNDFSLLLDGQKMLFDVVFLAIHGTPGENGKIQGYFELLGIPITGCDSICSAITFNKQVTKEVLSHYKIPMAPSIMLQKNDAIPIQKIQEMSWPLFVKPNKNGSSYGVSKVSNQAELINALKSGFEFDNQIIIEGFLRGTEYSCGLFRDEEKLHALPITEIIPENDFFDYAAKYQNQSQEITPANLDEEASDQCKSLSKEIYRILDCKGMARVDFIQVDGTFYFLEVNTIPGLSAESIIPQQVRAYGWSLSDFFTKVLKDAFIVK